MYLLLSFFFFSPSFSFQINGIQEFMTQINAKLDRLLLDRSTQEAHPSILYQPILNYYQDSLNEVNVRSNNVNSHNRKSTSDQSTSYPTIYSEVRSEGSSSSPPGRKPSPILSSTSKVHSALFDKQVSHDEF